MATISAEDRAAIKVRMAAPQVAEVVLDRVSRHNAMTVGMFLRVGEAFREITAAILAQNIEPVEGEAKPKSPLADVRCVIVTSASPKIFTAGIDFASAAEMSAVSTSDDAARTAFRTYHHVRALQDAFSDVARCPVPVIAAVHGPCIGAGVDLITACDIRVSSPDATYCVKEVDVGITADLGTLQRLPRIVGNQSVVRDWCYTGRNVPAAEALQHGLLSRVAGEAGPAAVRQVAIDLAKVIATKPPVAVSNTKASLQFNDDEGVERGLRHVALTNAAGLQTEDIMNAMVAAKKKKPAKFSKL